MGFGPPDAVVAAQKTPYQRGTLAPAIVRRLARWVAVDRAIASFAPQATSGHGGAGGAVTGAVEPQLRMPPSARLGPVRSARSPSPFRLRQVVNGRREATGRTLTVKARIAVTVVDQAVGGSLITTMSATHLSRR